MRKWFADRGLAIIVGGACYFGALIVFFLAAPILAHLKSPILTATIDHPPGGVTGADLIANLLTISALTISGCFAYICLPSDRIEVRIATYVEICFINKLVSKGEFAEYCSVIPNDRLTNSCKALRGLLSPRSGLGGWHRLTDEDLANTFGSSEWKVLSRFVDQHTDTKWIVLLSVLLSAAMAFGGIDLIIRYLGLIDVLFYPFEFAMIFLLSSLNVGTAYIAVNLAFGGSTVENRARERINVCVDEAREHVANWQSRKVDADLSILESEARAASGSDFAANDAAQRPASRVSKTRSGQKSPP